MLLCFCIFEPLIFQKPQKFYYLEKSIVIVLENSHNYAKVSFLQNYGCLSKIIFLLTDLKFFSVLEVPIYERVQHILIFLGLNYIVSAFRTICGWLCLVIFDVKQKNKSFLGLLYIAKSKIEIILDFFYTIRRA